MTIQKMRDKDYYQKNRDKILAKKKKYYNANKEVILKKDAIRREDPKLKKEMLKMVRNGEQIIQIIKPQTIKKVGQNTDYQKRVR